MKLLFVFTGGTIGSREKSGVIAPEEDAPRQLLSRYEERWGMDFAYDEISPYTLLSENLDGSYLSALIAALREALARGTYDGVIVTHGTDTLQYTAAALGYCFGNACLPICLVSSQRPLEDARANGLENLRAAIALIAAGTERGVFVSYQDPGTARTALHRGTRLLASQAYSDRVCSVRDIVYGWVDADGRWSKNAAYTEAADAIAPFSGQMIGAYSKRILRLAPYAGLGYPRELPREVKYILHESYHSGTIGTEAEESAAFFRMAAEAGVRVYLSGAAPGAVYESAVRYAAYGLRVLPVMSPVAAYMKLWLAESEGQAAEERMEESLGGDILA